MVFINSKRLKISGHTTGKVRPKMPPQSWQTRVKSFRFNFLINSKMITKPTSVIKDDRLGINISHIIKNHHDIPPQISI